MTGGDYAGLFYWQVGSSALTLNGSVSISSGAWYAPSGTAVLNSGAALTVSALVTKDLTVNGGATLTLH